MHLGFGGMGLSELLSTAKVPKGSFYHYFRSKEVFGEDMLARYFEHGALHRQQLFNSDLPDYRSKLLAYYQGAVGLVDRQPINCLVVKLSGEVCDLSEPMRQVLHQGTEDVILALQDAVKAGIQDGSLSPELDPVNVAESFYSLLVGALLRGKIQRSAQPLDYGLKTIALLLSPPA